MAAKAAVILSYLAALVGFGLYVIPHSTEQAIFWILVAMLFSMWGQKDE